MCMPDTALILVNLGTPDAPTPKAVRRYLSQFLHDHRVVQLSRWLWCPLLHGVILPLRGAKVARKYAEIWLEGGSPLAVHTANLAMAVQQRLPDLRVIHAMRYGNPGLDMVLRDLRDSGIGRVMVLPLYPQYSTTTTASVTDVMQRYAGGIREGDQRLGVIEEYHLDPGWVEAVAASIRTYWSEHGRGERLLFSYHGVPQRLADAGDPYPQHCEASTAAIVRALEIPAQETILTFQSRFGREPWLQPYTDHVLRALAAEGVKRVDVVCPGFAVDCLETLEEISIQNAALFRDAGGATLNYIPCLNATAAHADALATLAQRKLDEIFG
ncbi:MAG: ferrochelatase [Lysobacteraceae bacterium]|nr:MAG: ferrochelatase [Xanthomonadaceae bacterium]